MYKAGGSIFSQPGPGDQEQPSVEMIKTLTSKLKERDIDFFKVLDLADQCLDKARVAEESRDKLTEEIRELRLSNIQLVKKIKSVHNLLDRALASNKSMQKSLEDMSELRATNIDLLNRVELLHNLVNLHEKESRLLLKQLEIARKGLPPSIP